MMQQLHTRERESEEKRNEAISLEKMLENYFLHFLRQILSCAILKCTMEDLDFF